MSSDEAERSQDLSVMAKLQVLIYKSGELVGSAEKDIPIPLPLDADAPSPAVLRELRDGTVAALREACEG